MSDREQQSEAFEHDGNGAASAASIGGLLREAREARGESVGDVAHVLKLRPRQIKAIEAGRFDLLPGHAFVKGFVRNYARHLGVEVEPRLSSLGGHAGEAGNLSPVASAEGVMPTGGAPFGLLRLLGFGVFAGVMVLAAGWYFDWFRVAPTHAPVAGPDEAVEAGSPLPALAGPAAEGDGAAGPVPEREAEPPRTLASHDQGPDGASLPLVAAPLAAGAEEEMPVAEQAETGAAEAAGGRLVLRTEAESWIEVRDAAGSALHIGTEAAGSTLSLEGEPPFSLVIGNAASVALEYDGEPVDLAPHIRSAGVARLQLE